MNGSSYRIAFERLKAALIRAEEGSEVEPLERARAAMDAFVASLVVDPRRLRALAASSPAAAAEVQRRAAEIEIPRMVLDPVHDPSFARLWLATLSDAQLAMLQRVVRDEAACRRDDALPQDYAPRRRALSVAPCWHA
jgi:hypothetical protein